MTDWMPIVGVALAGVFTTLGLAGRALQAAPAGARPDLSPARRAFWISLVATAAIYVTYLVLGESWLWYV